MIFRLQNPGSRRDEPVFFLRGRTKTVRRRAGACAGRGEIWKCSACDYRRTGTGGVSVERGTGRCRPTANKKNPVLSAANTPPVPVRMWSEHAFHISPAAVLRTRHGGRIFVPLLQKVKRIIVFEEMHQLISTHDRN